MTAPCVYVLRNGRAMFVTSFSPSDLFQAEMTAAGIRWVFRCPVWIADVGMDAHVYR